MRRLGHWAARHWMKHADLEAKRSLDPSTQVGGVLLIGDGGLQDPPRFYGHNQFPSLKEPGTATREERYADVVHAEEVALMYAGWKNAQGAAYVGTHEPCDRCYRRLIWAGVKTIAFRLTSPDRRERWGCVAGRQAALDAGIEIIEVEG